MTQPQDPMHKMLTSAFEALRATVHDELSGMRQDLTGLSRDVRDQIPRIAVLEHRANQQDHEIDELKRVQAREKSEEQARRQWSVGTWISAVLGAIAILATLVIGILNLTQGG